MEIGLAGLPKTEGSKDPDNFPEPKVFFLNLDLIYIVLMQILRELKTACSKQKKKLKILSVPMAAQELFLTVC